MLGSTLHRYRADARYLLLDTETEGLNLYATRPWQVAWAIADNKTMGPVHVSYVRWPNLDVSPDAAAITRFDYRTWDEQARDPGVVLAELEAEIYREHTEVLWQNGLGFDAHVLATWRRLLGKRPDFSYLTRCIELTALTKALKKQWKPDISSPEAWLSWQYKCLHWIEKGLKSGLEQCGKEEGIEHDYTRLHDAAVDISLTHKVYQKRLFQLEF